MTLTPEQLELISQQAKLALIENLRQAEKGHFATEEPITALITIALYGEGESSISLVGNMDETRIFGAMEKTKFLIHDITLQAQVENEVNKVVAMFEAQSEKDRLDPLDVQ